MEGGIEALIMQNVTEYRRRELPAIVVWGGSGAQWSLYRVKGSHTGQNSSSPPGEWRLSSLQSSGFPPCGRTPKLLVGPESEVRDPGHKTMQAFAIALGYPPELDGNTLVQKTTHALIPRLREDKGIY